MNFALDNLLAAIIGCTVGIVLFASQQRINDHDIERLRYYAARRGQAVFLQTLERDLHNIVSLNSISMGATDSTFSFVAYLDSTNTATGTVAYRMRRAGTAAGTPIYRVTRAVTSGSTTSQQGGSLDTITGWRIESRSDDNEAVVSTSEARQVYVWFASVSPLINRSGDQRLASVSTINWEASYRPPSLRSATDL